MAATDDLPTLRLKYNVAWAAHQGCARALAEVRRRGDAPPTDLVEKEARAREAVDRARERLRLAMTDSITGHHQTLAEHSAGPSLASDTPADIPRDESKT